MPEKSQKVETFLIDFYCTVCDVKVKSNGYTQASFPPSFGHKCPQCSETYWLDKSYPAIEYKKN